ncbi:MAG: HAD family hydrolase [Sutterellaceae bacterium]|nr:HAD family hydrolase [Burkholderiaceae bacterium]MCX7900674.1 HAD family hydrolase [Burkholderiaceae bacterium]MDW8431029.1 HAD family hydrolase [Sutterellaceae bacterium]
MSETIEAAQLGQAWEKYGKEASVLSLDCFDTLIWRTVAEPADVFCELPAPLTRTRRMVAERTARARARASGRQEVTLEEIYRIALPAASEDERNAAVAAELAAEKRVCRAFAPAVALIRAAKANGARVIVVSDTYLTATQLAALIDAAAGEPLAGLLDAIFCSCDYGVSKCDGLFRHALRHLKVAPQRVLHIGDNTQADLRAPRALGIRAYQLLAGDASWQQQWRMEAAALVLADPALRAQRAPHLPYRLLLAAQPPPAARAERLGFGTLGPVMYAFADWVRNEARTLAAEGRPVKVGFLMRDGYLAWQVYQLLKQAEDPPAAAVEMSRFTAFAASLRTIDDILDYFALVEDGLAPAALGKQLLLTPEEVARVSPDGRCERFQAAVLQPAWARRIFERSAQFRRRLLAHVRQVLELQPGQILLLVDLGYAGTVQNRIQHLFAEELRVEVAGRYLLLRDVPRSDDARRAFFGPDRLDARLLECLQTYVAALEQLSGVSAGSVVDYSPIGEPVRKSVVQNAQAEAFRVAAQRACLRFVAEAVQFDRVQRIDAEARWQGALACLARLLLLPAKAEAEQWAASTHDVNLGVADVLPLVNLHAAREDLRRLGAVYARSAPRVLASAELSWAGHEIALAHLTRARLGIDLRVTDLQDHALQLPAMVARNGAVTRITVHALPTFEGFYAALIPVGRGEYAVGAQFGAICEWLQLESARLVPQRRQFEAFYRAGEVDLTAAAVHEGIAAYDGGLLHCLHEHAFSYFEPTAPAGNEPLVLRIVFRPLVERRRGDVNTAAAVPHAAGREA